MMDLSGVEEFDIGKVIEFFYDQPHEDCDDSASDGEANQSRVSRKRDELENPCEEESFLGFRETMTKINEKIYKSNIIQGSGELLDLERFRISYQFASFMEGCNEPIAKGFAVCSLSEDITPLMHHQIALTTMKMREESVFWISKEEFERIFFGNFMNKGNVLFRCRILNVIVPKKNQKPESLLKHVMKQVKLADENFQRHNFYGCIDIYIGLIRKLENARTSTEEEDEKRKKWLVKIYQNIIICYNKVDRPKKTCIMIRDMSRLTDINKNHVVLFAKGKAQMMLGDYGYARKLFNMSYKLHKDRELYHKMNERLNRLEESKRSYDAEIESMDRKFLETEKEKEKARSIEMQRAKDKEVHSAQLQYQKGLVEVKSTVTELRKDLQQNSAALECSSDVLATRPIKRKPVKYAEQPTALIECQNDLLATRSIRKEDEDLEEFQKNLLTEISLFKRQVKFIDAALTVDIPSREFEVLAENMSKDHGVLLKSMRNVFDDKILYYLNKPLKN